MPVLLSKARHSCFITTLFFIFSWVHHVLLRFGEVDDYFSPLRKKKHFSPLRKNKHLSSLRKKESFSSSMRCHFLSLLVRRRKKIFRRASFCTSVPSTRHKLW
jgi:hypothetical protein